MKPNVAELALPVLAGALLGVLHFGGLLWTVGRLTNTRHPLLVAMASSIIRCVLLAAALLWLSGFNFWRILALLVGVGVGRLLVIRYSLRSLRSGKGKTDEPGRQ
ncbi:MAG: ATP synthase subunit I [Bacillota bacterium]